MFKNYDLDAPMTRRDYMNLGLVALGITAIIEVGIYVWYKFEMNRIERSYSSVIPIVKLNCDEADEEDEDEEDYGL